MSFFRRHLGPDCGCDAPDPKTGMIGIDEAFSRIIDTVAPVPGTERVDLDHATGRVLAAPITALSDMPRFDHSAMDGYALRVLDLTGRGPWRLPVTLRCAAGEAIGTSLAPSTAARIFTGAPVPEGADCVVMQEEVDRWPGGIVLRRRPARNENIRFRAEDTAKGVDIVAAGGRMGTRCIAAAAAGGHGAVVVRRRIRVGLLVSGAELARPGTPSPGRSGIWDVNTPMLRSFLTRPDVDLVDVGAVPDDLGQTHDALGRMARDCDLVVTSGGVSVGEEDHMRTAIRALGGTEVFAGVAIKPGKPVAFGRLGGAVWLGLPGNPQSAFVTWTLFGEAILGRLCGRASAGTGRRHVVLAHPVQRKAGRCEVRAAAIVGTDGLGRDLVDCAGPVRSGQVTALAAADGLVLLPADADLLPRGALVEILPFQTC